MKTINVGDMVILKDQISKRKAMVDGVADNGNLFLLRFENGATVIKKRASISLV